MNIENLCPSIKFKKVINLTRKIISFIRKYIINLYLANIL